MEEKEKRKERVKEGEKNEIEEREEERKQARIGKLISQFGNLLREGWIERDREVGGEGNEIEEKQNKSWREEREMLFGCLYDKIF